jgi:hypothetical protein
LWKVTDAVEEVLNRIEQQKEEEPELPEGITALELLRLAYRGKIKLTPQQTRCAIESLPYENPKLSATAIATMDGQSFAEALDRCIERSGIKPLPPPKVIEAKAVEQVSAEVMKKPFSNYRNNFRRY